MSATVLNPCPVSVTTLKQLAAALQQWAATLPPGQLEADVLVAWCDLRRAAAMLPATNDQEVGYHRRLRDQFEITDGDMSVELSKLTRELGASVAEVTR